MEFSVACDYHSYLISGDFKVWFSCSCIKPELIEKMNSIEPAADGSLEPWQQRVLFALRRGDCRVSFRSSGGIVFEGHEFISEPIGTEAVKIRFNDDCIFTVKKEDVIEF